MLKLACVFAAEVFDGAPKDAERPLLKPDLNIGRSGPPPELIRLADLPAEAEYLAGRLRAAHAAGLAWRQMAVLYRDRASGQALAAGLRAAGLPLEWLNETSASRHYRPDQASVKLMTMHASKGLEFRWVGIAGLGVMPYPGQDPQAEAKLLYVAMTRAVEQLVMTCHEGKTGVFVERIDNIIKKS